MASFLLEVIQYIQYLQEKVQKYEGSYEPWSSEPTKLMPWRSSHWRMQSFLGHPQAIKNGSGTASTFPGRFDENNVSIPLTTHQQNAMEPDLCRDASSKMIDQQTDLTNQTIEMAMPLQATVPIPVQVDGAFSHSQPKPASHGQSTECPIPDETLNHQEEMTIEGGTISISSIYSEGLLNTLTQALQTARLDLSQATISVQINLGKQAQRELASGVPISKDHENSIPCGNEAVGHFRDTSNGGDLNQAQKRLKM